MLLVSAAGLAGCSHVRTVLQAAPASAVTFVAYEFFISLLLKAANTAEQA